MNRRGFLYGATVVMGAADVAATARPFIDQMNPDAGIRVAGDAIDLTLAELRPTEQRVVHWAGGADAGAGGRGRRSPSPASRHAFPVAHQGGGGLQSLRCRRRL